MSSTTSETTEAMSMSPLPIAIAADALMALCHSYSEDDDTLNEASSEAEFQVAENSPVQHSPISRSPSPSLSIPEFSSPSTSESSALSITSASTSTLFTTEFFEVRKSPKGGYGAFAVKDIEIDTVIMSEEPLFRAMYMEVFDEYERLTMDQRRDYNLLHAWMGVDHHRVLAIFKTNRFAAPASCGGIFLKSSRFNHACHPYATCTYFFDFNKKQLVTRALHPIKYGQEITISYTSNQNSLYENYGFHCDCPGCVPEDESKANLLALKRLEIEQKFHKLWLLDY